LLVYFLISWSIFLRRLPGESLVPPLRSLGLKLLVVAVWSVVHGEPALIVVLCDVESLVRSCSSLS
jgi:hypothetical protein